MSLNDLQFGFSRDVAQLLIHAQNLGYRVTLGEAYRTPQQAELDEQSGSGIADSLHCERLAIDLNLFQQDANGWQYIMDGTGHEQLAAWWKSLSPSHRWGGDFPKKDYNHYSISPDGVRG